MTWKKINKIVSYWDTPSYGEIGSNNPVMALSVDKSSKDPYIGVMRVVTKREGDPNIPGFLDRSKLIIVKSKDLLKWEYFKDLEIGEIKETIKKISSEDKFFIGLEDPDIWNEGKMKHLYFTIAFKYLNRNGYEVYLGHAEGKDLESLISTAPVLSPIEDKISGFKEVCISPEKDCEKRICLTETAVVVKDSQEWMIGSSKAKEMSKKWEYQQIVLNPKEQKYGWCKKDLSPCSILPREVISYGNLLVGIVNGREEKRESARLGKFRPGLILFDFRTGKIPWISPEPLFEDPASKGITFSSDFIKTKKNEGLLYCHVDDSFVRAYKINLLELRKYIRKNSKEII